MSRNDLTRRRVLTWTTLAAVGTTVGTAAAPVVAHAAPTGETVRVSEVYGHPEDATAAIQAALDSGPAVVIVDNDAAGGEAVWQTGPLHVRRDGVTLVLEPGVRLQAITGGFPGNNDCLLTIEDRTDVTVRGPGAVMAMNKAEYTTGEWRMGISVLGSHRVRIEGLTIRETGGDGIYLGVSRTRPASEAHCYDITISGVECVRATRNALSVISVDTLLVEHSTFWQSSGKSPQGGVDFEPNHPTNVLKRIVMRDCRIDHNGTYGLIVSLARLDATSQPVDIVLERIVVGTTGSQIPNFTYYGSGDSDPGGRVQVRDSLIRKSPISGAVGVFKKAARGVHLSFHNCVIWDYRTTFRRWQPITVTPLRSSDQTVTMTRDYGGVWFHSSHLITDVAGPAVTQDREPAVGPGMADLHGDLAVSSPSGSDVAVDLGARPERCPITVTGIGPLVRVPVTAVAHTSAVRAGTPAVVTFRRTTDDLRAPLAVSYGTGSGTAVPGQDFLATSGAAVIPAGATEVEVPIRTMPRAVGIGPLTLVVALSGGYGYQLGTVRRVTVRLDQP